jgi:hypothetical protein
VHTRRFAAAWVRVRARRSAMGNCVLRETIRKGRPRFAPRVWLSISLSISPIYRLCPFCKYPSSSAPTLFTDRRPLMGRGPVRGPP